MFTFFFVFMVNQDKIDSYIGRYSSGQLEVLDWLEKETNLRTSHARMLSGQVVGRFLGFVVDMLRPMNVLELGCFTGYSAICMASSLPEGGHLDTLELNDELEDLILEGFAKAGVADRITLHIGDALDTLRCFDRTYDLVYIDANKRDYGRYYEAVIDMLRPGGYILADNVLWDGKVCADPMPSDAQTRGIHSFNELVRSDSRVENVILPFRDGVNMIRKR